MNRQIRNAVLGLIFVVSSIGTSFAQGVEETDEAIQNVILSQIEAFANEDKQAAWGFASEGIQRQTGSVDTFYNMVRMSYEPVHKATSIEFLKRIPHPGFQIQLLHIVGPDGNRWKATYRMELNDDNWRVAGVSLEQAPGTI